MAYLGNPGQMMDIACASALPVSHTRPSASITTLGGRRKLQVGPRVRRSWQVTLPSTTTARDASVMTAFVYREYGPGPFWWVSDWAEHTNVLPPEVSLLEGADVQSNVIPSSPMALPDGGVSGRSIYVDAGSIAHLSWSNGAYLPIPLVVGRRTVLSAYLAGTGALIQARMLGPTGNVVRTVASNSTASWQPERVVATIVPREGEHAVLIRVVAPAGNGVRATRPAITYTDTVQEWAVGAGAPRVAVLSQDIDPTIAWDTRQLAGSSYEVLEVG